MHPSGRDQLEAATIGGKGRGSCKTGLDDQTSQTVACRRVSGDAFMSIPELQLETWSQQGATTTAQTTYQSVQTALRADTSLIKYYDFDVYLQGSYRNTTNIRGDSDVDVVVELNSVFNSNVSSLTTDEVSAYHRSYSDASYTFGEFRSEVLASLMAYYGSAAVSEGNKSIKVDSGTSRLPSDVVPCLEHRKYNYFMNTSQQSYVEGIVFYTRRENRRVVNFPKVHYENGARKKNDANTRGSYKPTVRMFKNARSRLVNNGVIESDVAPSYFVECFLYNVANDAFSGDYGDRYINVLSWLANADFDSFVCQNEQTPLFGDTPEQWSKGNAIELLAALIKSWRDW